MSLTVWLRFSERVVTCLRSLSKWTAKANTRTSCRLTAQIPAAKRFLGNVMTRFRDISVGKVYKPGGGGGWARSSIMDTGHLRGQSHRVCNTGERYCRLRALGDNVVSV